MINPAIEYLTDSDGNPKAVVIPIELWRKLLPQHADSPDNFTHHLADNLEDYCLGKAMDAALDSPVMDREAAIAFLEQEGSD